MIFRKRNVKQLIIQNQARVSQTHYGFWGPTAIFKIHFLSSGDKVYRGLVSEETVVLRRWGSETRKFGLSTELIM